MVARGSNGPVMTGGGSPKRLVPGGGRFGSGRRFVYGGRFVSQACLIASRLVNAARFVAIQLRKGASLVIGGAPKRPPGYLRDSSSSWDGRWNVLKARW